MLNIAIIYIAMNFILDEINATQVYVYLMLYTLYGNEEHALLFTKTADLISILPNTVNTSTKE